MFLEVECEEIDDHKARRLLYLLVLCSPLKRKTTVNQAIIKRKENTWEKKGRKILRRPYKGKKNKWEKMKMTLIIQQVITVSEAFPPQLFFPFYFSC